METWQGQGHFASFSKATKANSGTRMMCLSRAAGILVFWAIRRDLTCFNRRAKAATTQPEKPFITFCHGCAKWWLWCDFLVSVTSTVDWQPSCAFLWYLVYKSCFCGHCKSEYVAHLQLHSGLSRLRSAAALLCGAGQRQLIQTWPKFAQGTNFWICDFNEHKLQNGSKSTGLYKWIGFLNMWADSQNWVDKPLKLAKVKRCWKYRQSLWAFWANWVQGQSHHGKPNGRKGFQKKGGSQDTVHHSKSY